eukprot:scaffold279697_cov32-Tisochrysis_lutea.AAC.3
MSSSIPGMSTSQPSRPKRLARENLPARNCGAHGRARRRQGASGRADGSARRAGAADATNVGTHRLEVVRACEVAHDEPALLLGEGNLVRRLNLVADPIGLRGQ